MDDLVEQVELMIGEGEEMIDEIESSVKEPSPKDSISPT
jgi:hypothetical protein